MSTLCPVLQKRLRALHAQLCVLMASTNMLFLWLPLTLVHSHNLPLVDPGLFVISGVTTCGGSGGYCLLGLDCTLDEDFLPDDQGGHCEGLKSAFTPSAHFICCKANNRSYERPPIVFPSVATYTSTETTEITETPTELPIQSTTPNDMENEIDQVLLKLAQSISSVKQSTDNEAESEFDATSVENESYVMNVNDGNYTQVVTDNSALEDNETNADAEWLQEESWTNVEGVEPREDYEQDEKNKENNIVISTLDDTSLSDEENSFYSIMKKEENNVSTETAVENVGMWTNATGNQSVPASGNNTYSTVPTFTNTIQPLSGKHCSPAVKFIFQNDCLCFGSVLNVNWIVTSGSCALRVFRAGMLNVTVSSLTGEEQALVRTIIVHENYRQQSPDISPTVEANNIGLVRLKTNIEGWESCTPHLPKEREDFAGHNCSGLFNYTDATPKEIENYSLCRKRVERLISSPGNFTFLTLFCNMPWGGRDIAAVKESGAPLLCNGVLAGVESSSGVGTLVYTPVSQYLKWILDSIKLSPDQKFNV